MLRHAPTVLLRVAAVEPGSGICQVQAGAPCRLVAVRLTPSWFTGRLGRPPQVPLDPGEFTEVVLRGRLTDPSGPGRLAAKAERFLGHRLGTSRWVLLTTRRLLVVAPFPREGDWFDVAFDRREVTASPGVKRGDLITVDLATPAGRQVLRVPVGIRSEVSRFVRALRR